MEVTHRPRTTAATGPKKRQSPALPPTPYDASRPLFLRSTSSGLPRLAPHQAALATAYNPSFVAAAAAASSLNRPLPLNPMYSNSPPTSPNVLTSTYPPPTSNPLQQPSWAPQYSAGSMASYSVNPSNLPSRSLSASSKSSDLLMKLDPSMQRNRHKASLSSSFISNRRPSTSSVLPIQDKRQSVVSVSPEQAKLMEQTQKRIDWEIQEQKKDEDFQREWEEQVRKRAAAHQREWEIQRQKVLDFESKRQLEIWLGKIDRAVFQENENRRVVLIEEAEERNDLEKYFVLIIADGLQRLNEMMVSQEMEILKNEQEKVESQEKEILGVLIYANLAGKEFEIRADITARESESRSNLRSVLEDVMSVLMDKAYLLEREFLHRQDLYLKQQAELEAIVRLALWVSDEEEKRIIIIEEEEDMREELEQTYTQTRRMLVVMVFQRTVMLVGEESTQRSVVVLFEELARGHLSRIINVINTEREYRSILWLKEEDEWNDIIDTESHLRTAKKKARDLENHLRQAEAIFPDINGNIARAIQPKPLKRDDDEDEELLLVVASPSIVSKPKATAPMVASVPKPQSRTPTSIPSTPITSEDQPRRPSGVPVIDVEPSVIPVVNTRGESTKHAEISKEAPKRAPSTTRSRSSSTDASRSRSRSSSKRSESRGRSNSRSPSPARGHDSDDEPTKTDTSKSKKSDSEDDSSSHSSSSKKSSSKKSSRTDRKQSQDTTKTKETSNDRRASKMSNRSESKRKGSTTSASSKSSSKSSNSSKSDSD